MRRDGPGKVVAGRYELLETAGEGGMAVVWRAWMRRDTEPPRAVAVKRIHAGKGADQSFVRLFEEEARVGAHLHHPNIVEILDFGVDEHGDYYLVLEWIEGLDLHQWVRSYPRGIEQTPWPLATAIVVHVLRALAFAHERSDETGKRLPIYHRDVSPSNVLLGTDGSVKLTDFGLARAMDRASMTRPNVIKGKLAYCAPELISGAKVGAHSDMFALGVVLWETLAQQRLFTGKNDLEVLLSVRKGDVTRLSELRTDIPGALEAAVHRAVEPEPKDRFQSANAMVDELCRILERHRQRVDAATVGQSVVDARERLGLAAAARKAASTEEISLADISMIDAPPRAGAIEIDLDFSRQTPSGGVWSSRDLSDPKK
jgi:serine/threonine-protein kinase